MSGMIGISKTEKSVEWYTPKWVFDTLNINFDLDPCSPFNFDTHVPATTKYTIFDDGLSKEWIGRVWLNPPYGREVEKWIKRMIDHKNGIALVFSRTDSKWCQEAMKSADAVLFYRGRISFIDGATGKQNNNGGAGSLFLTWGEESVRALSNMSDKGFMIFNSAKDGE